MARTTPRSAAGPGPAEPTILERLVRDWRMWCGVGSILAALPTVVWRLFLASGATLGTPASWRHSEQLPGSGVGYVVSLSVLQLAAALMSVVLFVPGLDRVPRFVPRIGGRRLPTALVIVPATAGLLALIGICVLSVIHWDRVDPFRDAPTHTAWTYLCWACYLAALLWPVLMTPTLVGYVRRRSGRPPPG